LASPANVSGAEGPQRIAPAKMASQHDSHIPPGSIRAKPVRDPFRRAGWPASGAGRWACHGLRGRLTPTLGPTYHPPDDDAPYVLRDIRRVCVPLGEDGATVPEVGSRGSQDRPDEADVPAQEAPSCQGARLSRPHEDDRGTPDPGCAASSGPEAADRLTSERGPRSPRLVMLSRPQDFAAIQERGTTRSNPLLSARFLQTDLPATRFGISTGRRLGTAVVRNRVRRRLREALRVMAPSFQPGWDVLIIARPGIVGADHDALVGALQRTLVRGGVLGGSVR
jgi:ribonuclease P protein component